MSAEYLYCDGCRGSVFLVAHEGDGTGDTVFAECPACHTRQTLYGIQPAI